MEAFLLQMLHFSFKTKKNVCVFIYFEKESVCGGERQRDREREREREGEREPQAGSTPSVEPEAKRGLIQRPLRS